MSKEYKDMVWTPADDKTAWMEDMPMEFSIHHLKWLRVSRLGHLFEWEVRTKQYQLLAFGTEKSIPEAKIQAEAAAASF